MGKMSKHYLAHPPGLLIIISPNYPNDIYIFFPVPCDIFILKLLTAFISHLWGLHDRIS